MAALYEFLNFVIFRKIHKIQSIRKLGLHYEHNVLQINLAENHMKH